MSLPNQLYADRARYVSCPVTSRARARRDGGDDTCTVSLSLFLSHTRHRILLARSPSPVITITRPRSRERENCVAHGCAVATLRQFSPHPSTHFPNANVNYFLEKSRYVKSEKEKRKKEKKHTYASESILIRVF